MRTLQDQPLTEARPRGALGELLTLALPTVAQMASYTVMQFTDTYMLARVSDPAATAAGQSGMLSFTFISFGTGVLLLVNTLVSQAFGRGDRRACGQFLWQGLWFALLFGLAALTVLPFARDLFLALGHPPDLAAMETTYFQLTLAFGCLRLAATSAGQFLLAVNRPNLVLIAAVCGVLANVAANWLLIYGNWGFPRLGVAGAAWGTNIAVLVELLVQAGFIAWSGIGRRYHAGDWRLRRAQMRLLLRVGAPSGLQIVAEVSAWTVFTIGVMALYGEHAMAGSNYMFRWMMVSFMPAIAIGHAVTALVGRYIGAGRPDLAAARAHVGFAVAATYMVSCGALFYLLREPMIRLFSDDPEVIRYGALLLIMAGIYQFFDAMYVVYNGALRGAGDTLVPAIVLGTLCWALCVAGGYAVALLWPQAGVALPWAVACVYGATLGVFLVRRFVRGRWRSIRLEPGAVSILTAESATVVALQPTVEP